MRMSAYSGKPHDLYDLKWAIRSLNEEAPHWLQIVVWTEGYTWFQSYEHFRPE